MGKLILKNGNLDLFLLGASAWAKDIASQLNGIQVFLGCEAKDLPTFGDSATPREPGLIDGSIQYDGFVDSAGAINLFSRIGGDLVVNSPLADGDVGDPCVIAQSIGTSHEERGQIGEAQSFSLMLPCKGRPCRGKIAYDALTSAETGAGNGTEVSLGTTTANQELVAAIHLVEFSGTNIDFTIESDATGFASPTTRITFDSMTAVGAAFKGQDTPGAITPDDYYRVAWTGTFSSAKFLVGFGVRGIT